MPSAKDPLLSIDSLNITYDSEYGDIAALSDITLDIAPGQALGLVGESGSGKSTVAGAILNLLPPEARIKQGTILFEGREFTTLSPKVRRSLLGKSIGAVFQDPFTSLNPSLRIGEQISEPLEEHRGMSRKLALDRVREMLADVGISRTKDVAHSYPHQLSGGMQQRALIAMALICEPSLLILDEPTTALDVTIEAQLLDLLNDLRERLGLSLLFISHNLAVVRRLCDEACVLYAGQILERGLVRDIFDQPVHPYTKGLIASLPITDSGHRTTRLSSIPGNLPDLSNLDVGCIFASRCSFSTADCLVTTQTLKKMNGGRDIRCQKAEEVLDLPWKEDNGHTAPIATGIHENGEPIIHVSNLKKKYRIDGLWKSLRVNLPGRGSPIVSYKPHFFSAIDGVSLDIHLGEIVGLVGESGSGKSTLGRCMIHLLDQTSGSISFDGKRISQDDKVLNDALRRDSQIVFQNPDSSLNPRKRVRDIIGRPLELLRIGGADQIERRVQELLDMVNLPGTYADRFPHQLSGGEKQRVGIARSLATEPKIIVCDEAVSALDVSVQATIINLFMDLRDKLGLSILFISHDLSVVAHMADRIAVMYRGKICEIGPTKDILHPPYHPYTHALLSAIPQLAIAGNIPRVRLPISSEERENNNHNCNFRSRCPHKFGKECDVSSPPSLQVGNNHNIVCHHDLDALVQLESVI